MSLGGGNVLLNNNCRRLCTLWQIRANRSPFLLENPRTPSSIGVVKQFLFLQGIGTKNRIFSIKLHQFPFPSVTFHFDLKLSGALSPPTNLETKHVQNQPTQVPSTLQIIFRNTIATISFPHDERCKLFRHRVLSAEPIRGPWGERK